MSKTVLVLGAGTGGIVTASELSRLAGNDGDINPVRVLLFEKEEQNVLGPMLLWVMTGKRTREQVYRDTRELEGDGVEVVLGEIEKVDPEKIAVTVKGREYRGDYMVISLGMEQRPYHRLNDFGFDFYTVEGAAALHDHLEHFQGGKVAVVVPSLPVKGPTAPYQAAMLIEGLLRKKEITAEVSLYCPETEPLHLAGTELGDTVRQLLAEKGVRYYPEFLLVGATDRTLTFANGLTANYDLLVYTPKYQCPEVIRRSPLAGASGWIEADPRTLETAFPKVYAIGDITSIPLEMGDLLPKTGVFAQKQAQAVAYNIVQEVLGVNDGAPQKVYSGEGQLYIETGDGKAGTVEGNFYTWPFPDLKIKKPDHMGRWEKVLSEKYWWFKHF